MTDSPPRDPTLRETLLAAADDWSRRTGRSRARLATLAAGDGKFFDRLAGGGDCTTGMFERVMKYIGATLPAEAPPPASPEAVE